MQIANPIYDSVFKYMMEDNVIAKILISTIIKQDIVSLEFKPQENTLELDFGSVTVYRLDFSAKIKTDEGYKTVLIELQKAKFPTDIMRFRKYLGEQYKDKANSYQTKVMRIRKGKKVEVKIDHGIPILSIYFLGYALEHYTAPVVRVQRDCYDDTTNTKLTGKENFVECLTHDSYIIQIPYLREKAQAEVEIMLRIFDQNQKIMADGHILDIREEDYPEKYRPMIRRLQRAIAEPEVRKRMDIEDEIIEEFDKMSRTIEQLQEDAIDKEIAIEEKDKVIEEKDKVLEKNKMALEENKMALEEKDKVLEEKDKVLEEKDKVLEENAKLLEEKERLIQKLLQQQKNP